jgi:hypothetical protein
MNRRSYGALNGPTSVVEPVLQSARGTAEPARPILQGTGTWPPVAAS